MKITLDQTVDRMNASLLEEANKHNIFLEDIQDAFGESVHALDSLFKDGGFVRCEKYDDLAIPYALQFGAFDSDEFHEARTKALDKATEQFGY